MPTIDIPDIWAPSPQNIKALPLGLRKYIEALKKEYDPDDVRSEHYWLLEQNIYYKREFDRLNALLREAGIDPSKTK